MPLICMVGNACFPGSEAYVLFFEGKKNNETHFMVGTSTFRYRRRHNTLPVPTRNPGSFQTLFMLKPHVPSFETQQRRAEHGVNNYQPG